MLLLRLSSVHLPLGKSGLLQACGFEHSENRELELKRLLGQWIVVLADFRSLELHGDNRLWWVLSFCPSPAKLSAYKGRPHPSPDHPHHGMTCLQVWVAELPSNAGGGASKGPSTHEGFFSP